MQSIIQTLTQAAFHTRLEHPEIHALQQLLAELLLDLKARHYHFTAISSASHGVVNQRVDNKLAFDLPGVFGWGRQFAPPLLAEPWFSRLRETAIIVPDGDYWRSRVAVASMDGCLLLHSAHAAEDDYAVHLGPDDYRFYNWIDHYLTLHKPAVRRAVNVGCGAGGLAMVLATRLPQAVVTGVDSNPLALFLASASALGNGKPQLQWQQGASLSSLPGEFDLIVANLAKLKQPYPDQSILPLAEADAKSHPDTPSVATAASGDEMTRILASVEEAIARLAVRGTLLLYACVAIKHGRDALRLGVETLLEGSSLVYEYEELDPDIESDLLGAENFQQVDRIAAVVLALHKPLR
ncbi:methyltransferase [Methylobacillus glycogenes]|uniref:methyltransferase n=1 Tax=Methylobacillus glycogenes TaxID=406 RepID=UPI00046EE4A4|nr:methyltransferase [Methylobacillus glycogenes]